MSETVTPTETARNPQTISIGLDNFSVCGIATTTTLATSVAIGTAKLVFYYPFVLPTAMLVKDFLWLNGGTAAGHIQMGVYDEAFALLGNNGTTTSQGTISTLQTAAPTSNFWLKAPARYYLAITADDATSTFGASNAVTQTTGTLGGLGLMSETTSAFGLTNPGTPALTTTEWFVNCGISESTTA